MKRKLSVILIAVFVPIAFYLCLMLAVDIKGSVEESDDSWIAYYTDEKNNIEGIEITMPEETEVVSQTNGRLPSILIDYDIFKIPTDLYIESLAVQNPGNLDSNISELTVGQNNVSICEPFIPGQWYQVSIECYYKGGKKAKTLYFKDCECHNKEIDSEANASFDNKEWFEY
jgi:hypothetical protein